MTGSVHVVATFAVKGASSQVDDWKLSPDRESVKVVNPSVNPLEIYKRDQLAAYGQGCEFFGEVVHGCDGFIACRVLGTHARLEGFDNGIGVGFVEENQAD